MVVNLINKHGLMPKKCFPESFSCEASARMNCVLKSKVSSCFAFGKFFPNRYSMSFLTAS
jgi:aminopeptidase C